MRAGHGKVLRSATDPRARIRTQGLAYGVFRICDEKEGNLVLRAVLRDDTVQLAMTAMGDENIVQLHNLVYLILVQMFQSPDRSVGRDAHDKQSAVPVRIGESRDAFHDLISKGSDGRSGNASVRARTTPFLSIEELAFEIAIRGSREKVPMPMGIVVDVLRPDGHESSAPLSEGSCEEGWTSPRHSRCLQDHVQVHCRS